MGVTLLMVFLVVSTILVRKILEIEREIASGQRRARLGELLRLSNILMAPSRSGWGNRQWRLLDRVSTVLAKMLRDRQPLEELEGDGILELAQYLWRPGVLRNEGALRCQELLIYALVSLPPEARRARFLDRVRRYRSGGDHRLAAKRVADGGIPKFLDS